MAAVSTTARTTIQDEWGDFTGIPNEFILASAPLSDHARWLFVLLRFHTNNKTKTAFPSYQLIKDETGWGFNTIAKAIRELEAEGWLSRKKAYSGNTHYTLIRRSVLANEKDCIEESNGQSLPTERTIESKGQSLPTESPVLANGKPTKIESTKTEFTKTDSSASQKPAKTQPVKIGKPKNDFFQSFAACYEKAYACPYQKKDADFVQLAACQKQGGEWLNLERWNVALENYFASPMGAHTLAYFSANFGTFWRSALDRYGKPLQQIAQSSQFTAKTQGNYAAAQAFLAKRGQALEGK